MTSATTVIILLLVGPPLLRAQGRVPERLSSASTVFLINDTADLNRFDHLARAFQKWNRFRLVDTLDKADLIIAFGKNVGGPVVPGFEVLPRAGYSLTIRDRQTGVVLWNEDTKKSGAEQRLLEHLRILLPQSAGHTNASTN
jgi:hypothetical protein